MQKAKKTPVKVSKKDETAQLIAQLLDLSPDYVRKVARGDRNNKQILLLYQHYQRGKRKLIIELQKMVTASKKKTR
jgi:hypothetical protein